MIETQYVDHFAFAHITPIELKPETVDLLWTQKETNAGEGTNYGIGWGVDFDGEGNRFAGHNGGAVGGSTYFMVHPHLSMSMAIAIGIATNVSEAEPKDITKKIGRPFAKIIRADRN